MPRTPFRFLVLSLAVVLVAVASSGQAPPAFSRQLVQPVSSPAIDRGLRTTGELVPLKTFSAEEERLGRAAYVPGRVIVKFRSGVAAVMRQAAMASAGASAAYTPDYANFEILTIDPAADPEEVAEALSARADVEYAQASYRVYPAQFRPNDPLYPMQWNFPVINMERAWEINPGATPEITVAVLDSGVAFREAIIRVNVPGWRFVDGPQFPPLGVIDVPFAAAPDLIGPNRIVSPRDMIWDDDLPLDLDGHGTHVAGTVGQLTNNGIGVAGMAFNVRIMPVKVISGIWDVLFGNPTVGTDDVVARGIRFAVDNGARVLNMSIGRTGAPAPVIEDALQYAVSRGAFVAIAAGNEFERGNPISRLAEIAGRIDGVISVAAVGREQDRAFYSTVGPYVEITAPGGDQRRGGRTAGVLQQTLDQEQILTFIFGPYRAPRFDMFVFEFFQGTSMAAPHVAGFGALLMQQGITNPAAIEAAMKRFAVDRGTPGRNDEYGHGIISPRETLRGLGIAR